MQTSNVVCECSERRIEMTRGWTSMNVSLLKALCNRNRSWILISRDDVRSQLASQRSELFKASVFIENASLFLL